MKNYKFNIEYIMIFIIMLLTFGNIEYLTVFSYVKYEWRQIYNYWYLFINWGRAYNSLGSCLNSPPKPHAFVNLPLHSGWFNKNVGASKTSFLSALTDKLKKKSFWCSAILSTLLSLIARQIILLEFGIKIEDEICNLTGIGVLFVFFIKLFNAIIKIFSMWYFDEAIEIQIKHKGSNNNLLGKFINIWTDKQPMLMGGEPDINDNIKKDIPNISKMEGNQNQGNDDNHLSSKAKGKRKANTPEYISDSEQKPKHKKLLPKLSTMQNENKAGPSNENISSALGLKSDLPKNASKTDYTPVNTDKDVMPWVNTEAKKPNDMMPGSIDPKGYRDCVYICTDYKTKNYNLPEMSLEDRIIFLRYKNNYKAYTLFSDHFNRKRGPGSWSDMWCYDTYRDERLESLIKAKPGESAEEFKDRIINYSAVTNKAYNKDFTYVLSEYFKYNHDHLEDCMYMVHIYYNAKLTGHNSELAFFTINNIQNIRQTVLQDAYEKGFISQLHFTKFSQFATHIFHIEKKACEPPIPAPTE